MLIYLKKRGRPLPGVKFNIFNAAGREAKDGEIGENNNVLLTPLVLVVKIRH